MKHAPPPISWRVAIGPVDGGTMTNDQSDPVVDEIRETRQRIEARFDHDPARLVAYYMKLQERHADRLIDPSNAKSPTDQSAA